MTHTIVSLTVQAYLVWSMYKLLELVGSNVEGLLRVARAQSKGLLHPRGRAVLRPGHRAGAPLAADTVSLHQQSSKVEGYSRTVERMALCVHGLSLMSHLSGPCTHGTMACMQCTHE